MIINLLFAVILIIALSYVFNRFKHQAPAKRKQISTRTVLYAVSGIVLLLIVTGRVHWISAIFVGIVPFLPRLIPLVFRLLPFLRQWRRHAAGSTLQTAYLRVQMDQSNGRLHGEVISGPHEGKSLGELTSESLNELLDYYQKQDTESYRLLYAYLQQVNGRSSHSYQETTSTTGNMARREALEILGLEEGATAADIQRAHKKLMQRIHPDRGGSTYLAAKVNQAKSILLQKTKP